MEWIWRGACMISLHIWDIVNGTLFAYMQWETVHFKSGVSINIFFTNSKIKIDFHFWHLLSMLHELPLLTHFKTEFQTSQI